MQLFVFKGFQQRDFVMQVLKAIFDRAPEIICSIEDGLVKKNAFGSNIYFQF